MALIKCPECGRQISDKAPACIYCGFPLSTINTLQHEKVVLTKEERIQHNITICNGEEFDLTELVEYLRKNTVLGEDIPIKIWREANNILKKCVDCDPSASNIINYIKIHQCVPESSSGLKKKIIESKTPKPKLKIVSSFNQNKNVVRCPRCGSTSVTTEEQGYGFFGWIGASQKKNLCQKCGHKWWPGR